MPAIKCWGRWDHFQRDCKYNGDRPVDGQAQEGQAFF